MLHPQTLSPMPLLLALRRATRRLLRAPTFTVTTILCLGLGVAVLAAMAALADSTLLRPLPFSKPDRLVAVWKTFDDPGSRGLQYFLKPTDFQFLRDEIAGVELAAIKSVDVDLTGTEEPVRVAASFVTAELATVLGLQPVRGRFFTNGEERRGSGVAVVSAGWWREQWGGDAGVLGRTLNIEGRPYTVIGVLPDDRSYPSDVTVWLPMRQEDWEGRYGVSVIGRLAIDATVNGFRHEIVALGQRLREIDANANATAGLEASSLRQSLSADSRPSLLGLLFSALAFLLIALANTSSLVIARAVRVRAETATRVALGAGRRILARQAVLDLGILVAGAAALGLFLAKVAVAWLLHTGALPTFSFAPPRVDLRIVISTLLLATAATLLLASIHLAASGGGRALVTELRGLRSTRRQRFMAILVVADLAITVVLLLASVQAGATVDRMMKLDTGLDAEGLLTAGVSASRAWAETQPQRVAFIDRLLEEVRTIPGVESAAAVHALPMTQPEYYWSHHVIDRDDRRDDARDTVLFRVIAGDYFATMGMRLLSGRGILPTDVAGSSRVVWANSAFVEQVWPDESPLGRQLVSAGGGEPLRVVGVVSDVRERGLALPVEPALYWPMAQWDRRFLSRMRLVIRPRNSDNEASVAELRQRLHAIDPAAVLFDVKPMPEIVLGAVSRQRLTRGLLALFAALAMVQAAAGVYGSTSYDVAGRSRELGLRLALGASGRRLLRDALAEGARRTAIGFVFGAAAAVALNRGLDALWKIGYVSTTMYFGVALILFTVGTLATLPAARRATRLDPALTLRADT